MIKMSIKQSLSLFIIKCLRSLTFQILALCGLFWLYHYSLLSWMKHHSTKLGDISFRHFVPFYAEVHGEQWFTIWLIPAVVVLIIYLMFVRRFYLSQSVKNISLLMTSIIFFVFIGLSVAMIDGMYKQGDKTFPEVLRPYTRINLEYFGDVPKIDTLGVKTFLKYYTSPFFFNSLSRHSKVHPPGGSLFQWLISKPFGYNLWSASMLSILFTSITVIPVFLLARTLYGETVSRYALAIFLIVPNFVMFTTTSMDGPFSFFPIWAVYLFFHSIKAKRKIPWSVLTGLAIALGMFMTYATFFLGLFFGMVLLLSLVFNRSLFKQELIILIIAFFIFVSFYLGLFIMTGFNFLETLESSIKQNQLMMGKGYPSLIHYLQISLANLILFLIGVGIPLSVVWFRACLMSLHRLRDGGISDFFVIGFLISLVLIAFSTLFNMEVERIWIFMVPFVVIPVANHLNYLFKHHGKISFYWVSVLMCLQIVLSEAILWTYW
ncbi:glycosyltransferase family 39 protein [Deltaproteobacteria bacterium]|nr:glycosyltransferase family 39 protein [Deltaproteobacteria bacterium]